MTTISTTTPKLTARLVARDRLTSGERAAMFDLMAGHFEGVEQGVFQADLDQKDWAVLLEDDAARLRGFSTFVMHSATGPAGEALAVVYSGDTIVDRTAWGTPTLPRGWIRAVYDVHARQFPGTRLIWLLITSGYRTYRFLPVFWREFYPRFNVSTPPEADALLRQLAADRFGDRFDPANGIVTLTHPQPLRGELRDVPPEKLADPHVAFFLDRNPGYVRGDELVCLADLAPNYLTPAGRRMVCGTSRPGQGG